MYLYPQEFHDAVAECKKAAVKLMDVSAGLRLYDELATMNEPYNTICTMAHNAEANKLLKAINPDSKPTEEPSWPR